MKGRNSSFQLLKSGTSFKQDRIKKVQQMFKKKEQPEEVKEETVGKVNFDNTQVEKIDAQLEDLKKEQKTNNSEQHYKQLINKRKEALQALRKHYQIKIEGDEVAELATSFETMAARFKFSHHFLPSIKEMGYKSPTPVQMQAIPILMQKRNAIILAETGSGKSLAFIAPLLEMIKRGDGLKAIVMAPTRELTIQLYKEFLMFSESHLSTAPRVKFLRKALTPKNEDQLNTLTKSCEVLIATPLKLAQLTGQFGKNITSLEYLVVDEADKMFEMGFLEQVDAVLTSVQNGNKITKFMFSATMQPAIQELLKTVMNDPVRVQIGVKNATAQTVKQEIVYVGREADKMFTLRQTLKSGFAPPMLIFVQSKHRAKELYHELIFDSMNVNVIHGDKKKAERDEIIKEFRLGNIWILICTDLMSRGIDFKTVNSVINFDFPTSLVSYIHRVGRTGRAGKEGTAATYFTDQDAPFVKTIANLMHKSGQDVPQWMLDLKGADNKDWKKIEKKPIKRKTISTSIEKNTNKRAVKAIKKDTRRNMRNNQGRADYQDQYQDDEENFDDIEFGDSQDEGGQAIDPRAKPLD